LVPRPTHPNRNDVISKCLSTTRREPLAALASKYSADIGIDDGDVAFVSKGQYRSSGVRPQPRQRKKCIQIIGNYSPVVLNNSNRSAMEIHSPSVVPKTCPFSYDVANGSLRASRNRRESLKKLMPARDNPRHLCLLQHQFRNNYCPRIAGLSPWQIVTTTSRPSEYRLDVRRSQHESVF
jgi:hypothetical protein